MVDLYRFETFRGDKRIVVLQSLKVSHLSVIPNRSFYESPKLKNWMCELCTFFQIQSHINPHLANLPESLKSDEESSNQFLHDSESCRRELIVAGALSPETSLYALDVSFHWAIITISLVTKICKCHDGFYAVI